MLGDQRGPTRPISPRSGLAVNLVEDALERMAQRVADPRGEAGIRLEASDFGIDEEQLRVYEDSVLAEGADAASSSLPGFANARGCHAMPLHYVHCLISRNLTGPFFRHRQHRQC